MAEIKGAALLGLVKYVKEKKGKDYLGEVIGKTSDDTQKIFSEKIITLQWYRYESFTELLLIFDREMGSGDLSLCREFGKNAAKMDIQAIYSLYKRETEPQRLIRDCSIVWPT